MPSQTDVASIVTYSMSNIGLWVIYSILHLKQNLEADGLLRITNNKMEVLFLLTYSVLGVVSTTSLLGVMQGVLRGDIDLKLLAIWGQWSYTLSAFNSGLVSVFVYNVCIQFLFYFSGG